MSMGWGEIVFLVVVIAVVFSASRMGQLGNAIGKFVYSFKKASKGNDLVDVTPKRVAPKHDVVDAEVTHKK